MEITNHHKTPSSVPANYVTILELKERWLKEKERKQKEEEQQEEELRQQKLREEQAKLPKPDAVVLKTVAGSRPRDRGCQTTYRPVNRSVSEREGAAELEEKKSQVPEEKKIGKKKWKKNKKNVRAEEVEVTEKKAIVDAPQASSDKVNEQAKGTEERAGLGVEIRAKSENVGPTAEIVPKFRGLPVIGEIGRGGDRLRRPSRVDHRVNGEIGIEERGGLGNEIRANSENVGPTAEIVPKFRGLSANGEIRRRVDWLRRPRRVDHRVDGEIRTEEREGLGIESRAKSENVGPKVEIVLKFRGLSVNAEIGRGGDRLREPRRVDHRVDGEIRTEEREGLGIESRAKSENVGPKVEIVPKFRGLSVNGEIGRGGDRLRTPSRVDHRVNGELGTEIRAQSENVGPTLEIVPKFRDLSVNGESGRGGDRLRRPSRVDHRVDGEIGIEKGEGLGIEIREKSENMGPKVEIVPELRALSENGESGRGDDRLRRPSRVHHRGNGEIGGYNRRSGPFDVQKQRGFSERVWVKKGEVADGNGGGVQSLERSDADSGQTGPSLNASSLKLAGEMSKNKPRRWWLKKGDLNSSQ